ncbi:MAG TPA: SseB family protein [Propionicimonas sp.]|nr:SseB family protein [Propionicimonas sp.]
MSGLVRPSAAYAGDRGEADASVRVLLAAATRGQDDYLHAIAALCTTRFLLPIVVVADADRDRLAGVDRIEPEHPERETPAEHHAEMVAVTLTAPDGRTGLPVFTGLDALAAWRPDARPVPCRLDEVAGNALDLGADAVLVDLAGPHPLVIEGDLIAQLAQSRRLVRLDDGGWGWLFAADSPASA